MKSHALAVFSSRSVVALTLLASTVATGCGDDFENQTSQSTTPNARVVDEGAIVSASSVPRTAVEIGRFEGRYESATGEFTFRQLPAVLPEGAELDELRARQQASVPTGSWCPAAIVQDGTIGTNPVDTFEIYSDSATTSFDPADCQALVEQALSAGDIPARLRVDAIDFFAGAFCFDTVVTSFFDTESIPGVIAEITLFDGATSEQPYLFPVGTQAPSVDDDTVNRTIATWWYGDFAPGESHHSPWVFRFGGNDFAFEGRLVAQVYEVCGNGIDDDCDGDVDLVDVDCHVGSFACTTNADCSTRNCGTSGFCEPDCRDGFWGPTCTWPCVSTTCGGNGTCDDGRFGTGVCACEPGSSGELCESCGDGYYGSSCDVCPGGGGASQCNGNGTCADGESGTGLCSCNPGFAGAACSGCAPGRYGATCAECPGGASNPCSGNGTCSEGPSGTGTCSCDSGYSGADCSIASGPAAPTGVSATDGTRGDGVYVTWDPSPGATSYEIYRDGVLVGTSASASGGDVEVSRMFACALMPDGTVRCWGNDDFGSLGDGVGASTGATARAVSGLTDVVDVSVGSSMHACAVTSDGTVWCWGYNAYGQLGANGTANAYAPVQVPSLTGVRSATVGHDYTCVTKQDGTVWCWGRNNNGQLGNGTFIDQASPVQVTGLSDVVELSSYGDTMCALRDDGQMFCWGFNNVGQVNPANTSSYHTPLASTWVSSVSTMSVISNGVCATEGDNIVTCWGQRAISVGAPDNLGTLGFVGDVLGISGNVVQIAGIAATTCALTDTGATWCWGNNSYGEMGRGL